MNVHGTRVHVYDTHLDFRADPSVRARQVRDMRAIMAEDAGKRMVLVGDFNAPPAAPELAPLWADLRDTLTAAGRRDTPTYPAAQPVKRLDYVTVSPGLAVDGARVPGSAPYRVASDHRPVVADLTVPVGRGRPCA